MMDLSRGFLTGFVLGFVDMRRGGKGDKSKRLSFTI